jgi:hypothetical protein
MRKFSFRVAGMKFLILLASLAAAAQEFPAGASITKQQFCQLALTHRNSELALHPLANVVILNDYTNPHPHELRAANKLATFLEERDQKVLLAPSLEGRSVPALDGVVLDATQLPVANIALKSAAPTTNLKRLIDATIDQIVFYSEPQKWVEVTNLFSSAAITPKNNNQSEKFKSAYNWMRRSYGVFGIGEHRPTIVFVEYDGNVTRALTVQDIFNVQRRMNKYRFRERKRLSGLIVSEVILQGLDGTYTIYVR